MAVEQQIQRQREDFARARSQIRTSISNLPAINQMQLRQGSVSPLMGRLQRRMITQDIDKLERQQQQAEQRSRDFEVSVANNYPQYADPQIKAELVRKAKDNIRAELERLDREKNKSTGDDRRKIVKKMNVYYQALNLTDDQLVRVDTNKIGKVAQRFASLVSPPILGATFSETTIPQTKYLTDSSGKLIGVEDPFKGESRRATAQDIFEYSQKQKGIYDKSLSGQLEAQGIKLYPGIPDQRTYEQQLRDLGTSPKGIDTFLKGDLGIERQERQQTKFGQFIDSANLKIFDKPSFNVGSVRINPLYVGARVSQEIIKGAYNIGSETLGTIGRLGAGKETATLQVTQRPLETISAGFNVASGFASPVLAFFKSPTKIKYLGLSEGDVSFGIGLIKKRIGSTKFIWGERALLKNPPLTLSRGASVTAKASTKSETITRELFNKDFWGTSFSKDVGLTRIKKANDVYDYFGFVGGSASKEGVSYSRGLLVPSKGKNALTFEGIIKDVPSKTSSVSNIVKLKKARNQAITKAIQQISDVQPSPILNAIKTTPLVSRTIKKSSGSYIPPEWQGVYDVQVPSYAYPSNNRMVTETKIKPMNSLSPGRESVFTGLRFRDKMTSREAQDLFQEQLTQQEQRVYQNARQNVKTNQRLNLGLDLFSPQKYKQTTITTTKTITRTIPKPQTRIIPKPFGAISLTQQEKKLKNFANSYTKAYAVLVKKAGKYQQRGVYSRGEALRKGEMLTLLGLSASFKITPTKGFISGRDKPYNVSNLFRTYKIKQGKKVPLLDEFIQRREFRLFSGSERAEIQRARRKKRKR